MGKMGNGNFLEGAINGDVPQMLNMDLSGNRYQDALMSGNTNRAFGTSPMDLYYGSNMGQRRSDPGVDSTMMKKGGRVTLKKSSASRGDGCATKGRTKGRIV